MRGARLALQGVTRASKGRISRDASFSDMAEMSNSLKIQEPRKPVSVFHARISMKRTRPDEQVSMEAIIPSALIEVDGD
jgi:hypothetical protein